MAKKESKLSGMSDAQKAGIGAGLAAAALAAAAGTYFLYGSKNAEKNRKTVKSWMLKAKAEVLEGIEKAQDMTQKDYEALVRTVSGAYAGVEGIAKSDVMAFAKDMKAQWDDINKSAIKATKAAAKSAAPKKASVKKVAKKVSQKTE
jgi:6-phosphogluconolactonase (cycloisomerase 2 family)